MSRRHAMSSDDPGVRLMRLNATIQGIATGVLLGVGLFVATNWLVIQDGELVGPHLGLLSQFFPGYRVTFLGSFIGAAYAFGLGFCVAYVVSLLYNWIIRRKAVAANNE